MTRRSQSDRGRISRREFIARSAAMGAALSVPALLAGYASKSAAAATDVFSGSASFDRGWRMRHFESGDQGAHLSDPNAQEFEAAQSALVPGTVLTSLVANGAVPDPYFGRNRDLIPDAGVAPGSVELYTYWFLHRFRLSQRPSRDQRVFLIFRGLNYSADVYLNGSAVAAGLEGAFLRRRFDVTEIISTGETNALAVLVRPPDPPGDPNSDGPGPVTWPSTCQGGDKLLGRSVTPQYSGGWDFTLAVADRNAGIWDEVRLLVTGPAVIESDPQITTTIAWQGDPGERPARAEVLATVEVRNTSAKAIGVELQFDVDGRVSTVTTQIAAGAVATMQTSVSLPRPTLWWPNGHGSQTLYPATVKIRTGRALSDTYQCQIGVREITSDVDPTTGGRVFKVNRRAIFIRGGNWTFPDAMLRHSAQDYDDQVRLHRLANLNLIRVWGGGIIERPEFYAACDRHGLLVWQEFPVTEDCKAGDQNPTSGATFLAGSADTLRMLRNHACLAIWVGGNEGEPRPDLDAGLRDLVAELDPKTAYVSSSLGEGFGPRDGPYDIKEPRIFFEKTVDNANQNPFNPEYGSVGLPAIESLRRFMPQADLEDLEHILVDQNTFGSLNRSWYLHHFQPFFSGEKTTPDQLLLYGRPTTIEAFCEQAQAAQFQQYKALYEGLNAGMWQRYTGGNLWRSQCGWPGLRGCLYDRYLEPTGGLFGVRHAAGPINVQIDLNNFDLAVVNNTASPLPPGLRVKVSVCDAHGKLQRDLARVFITDTAIAAASTAVVGSLTDVIDTATLQVVRTTLKPPRGGVLAVNLDWIADTARADSYAPLRSLSHVVLSVTAQGRRDKLGNCTVDLEIENATKTLAFFNRIRVWQPHRRALLLPVFHSDNYFSLLPGERSTVTLEFRSDPTKIIPTITLTGWNSSPGTSDDSVLVDWSRG